MTYSKATFPPAKYNEQNNGQVPSQENLTSERAKQIQAIVKQRQQKAGRVKQVIQNWKNVSAAIRDIQKEREKLTNDPNFAERLAQHDFTPTLESIKSAIKELENLEKRLSRNTLNAGVVGIMRNGKSELLQSITGLTQEHIPTSSKGVCTRGLSKIFHVSNAGEERNEIEFHSWSSFKEIIHLYFDKLGLPNRPVVPDDMGKRPPKLPEDKRKDINAQYLYGRLCKEYYAKFDLYKEQLNGSTITIPTEKISSYITYDEQSSNGEYLAVKELRVYCQFPYHEEVGQIGVIDLPGLGDDNIFDLERLIQTLKQDIDVILFVRMPNYKGDDWKEADRKMFQTAREALGEFPLSDCSFVVLNRIQEGNVDKYEVDNYELCQLFSHKLAQQKIDIKHPPIIANCSDPGEVNEKILSPVLNYLSGNIELVYQEYMRSCERQLQELQDDIHNQLVKASEAIVSEGEDLQFDYWFDAHLWPNLNSGLYQLLDELRRNKDREDETFKVAVEQAVERCLGEDIVPTLEEIEAEKYNHRASYKITYLVYIDQIRTKLSTNFDNLGAELSNLLEKVQSSVVDILIEKGNLRDLTVKKGNDFFQDIIQKLPRTQHESKLKKGFQDIQDYNVSYDKIIKEWIKNYLDKLQPDKNLDPISQQQTNPNNNPNNNPTLEKILNFIESQKQNQSESDREMSSILGRAISHQISSQIRELLLNPVSNFIRERYQKNEDKVEQTNTSEAELIAQELQTLRERIVTNCHDTLKKKLSAPNELAFTMVAEFLNQVLAPNVQTEWRTFLRKYQYQVWEGAKKTAVLCRFRRDLAKAN